MTSKQIGKLGVFYLQEAVLAILEESPEGLKPGEISKRLGIGPYADQRMSHSYGIVHGILVKLKTEGLTQRVNEEDSSEHRWQLQQN